MAKAARIRLRWMKSVSADVAGIKLFVRNGGVETVTPLPADTEEFTIVVTARGTFAFKLTTTDSEGLETTSLEYSHTLGDLEAPQPATELGHDIVEIIDLPDPQDA